MSQWPCGFNLCEWGDGDAESWEEWPHLRGYVGDRQHLHFGAIRGRGEQDLQQPIYAELFEI